MLNDTDLSEKTPRLPKITKNHKTPKKKKLENAPITPLEQVLNDIQRLDYHESGNDNKEGLPFSLEGFLIFLVHFILI
jgi:hypothetical protein